MTLIFKATVIMMMVLLCQQSFAICSSQFVTFRGCFAMDVAPIYFQEGLDQRQRLGANLKLYCRSIKRTSVNLNSTEKQGQFYSSVTEELYYSFIQAFILQKPSCLLFFHQIFSFNLFYKFLRIRHYKTFCGTFLQGLYCSQQWRRHSLINIKTLLNKPY